ncbi:ATP-binding protein [Pseudomonas asuensis]|uniref:ATP-binding protein n=1 Tax=Pseudomonas asuensis TaxID=1825787 RepID=A0ABQ2H270_9PSED|nr:ATP-binding protein [Pseudomonas asuensis]GGM23271.1 hypothetical protein GCM10009425_37660 [Pseudomonas asuensis]
MIEFAGLDTSPYTVHNVFTPTQPAKLTFIDRDIVNNDLIDALETPGTQVVVYGHTGSGKTTLLTNKLEQVYSHHITTRCMKGMTFEQILTEAFDQLTPFYESDRSNSSSESAKGAISASYLAIKSSLEATKIKAVNSTEKRALPPQLTPQALGRLIGNSGQCWVIEDFHKIEATEKDKLSQLLKVFMDLAYEYPCVKIVCLGAVDTARQVVDYDKEMKERVAEIAVPLMTEDELFSIITKGEKLLNIRFNQSTKRKVVKYACGIASICHRLCLNMCTSANIKYKQSTLTVIDDHHFDNAVEKYIRSASDSLKSSFDKALKIRRSTKFDSSTLIIKALSVVPERGLARLNLLKIIKEDEPNYTDHILKSHLIKLTEHEYGAILRYDSNSGLYSFTDPFHRAYAQSLQHTDAKQTTQPQLVRQIFITLKEDYAVIEYESSVEH